MIRTYNTADPFLLRLDQLNWVEEAPIQGAETFLHQQIANIRARPRLALGLALGAVVAMFLTAGALPAHDAVLPAAPASISVRSNDLDFGHAPDAQILLDRVEDAAEKACGGTPDYREHRRLEVFEHCRQATIRQTVARFDQPIVTQLAALQPMPMHLAVR